MGRIRYGLKNLYYAVATAGTGGTLTYATPVAIPGAKSISLAPAGTAIDEPADDVVWFHKDTNDGYTGTVEFEDTAAGDAFLADVLGMTTDTKDVVFEAASDEYKEFALLGQFTLEGGADDETGKRFCFFRCIATRPNTDGNTKEVGGLTVATNTVNITAMARISDDMVKASCDSNSTAYANWFTAVVTKSTQ